MFTVRRWSAYHPTYRSQQMEVISEWIVDGRSVAVVGLAGCGKSNLLGFLCHHPQALAQYVGDLAHSIILVPVDLNSVPSRDLATLYRIILRSFYETRNRLVEKSNRLVTQHYLENRATTDPFLPQSALIEILLHFQAHDQRVVLVMDQFDRFSHRSPSGMMDTLRSLRDSFKDTLCYIVGMRQAPKYLLNRDTLGELYEILDLHICWVGSMNRTDARRVVSEELHIPEKSLDIDPVDQIYALTGGYPSLLKAVCQRYADSDANNADSWRQQLGQDQNIRYRLAEIWQGFTQQEQVMLYSLAQGQDCSEEELASLIKKGLLVEVNGRWTIGASLLRDYAAEMGQFSQGTLWQDKETGVLYQGVQPLENLLPTETALLTFFILNPYKKHTYTEIITAVWTEDDVAGVTNQALAKQISNLRQRIEPNLPAHTYIITWRGKPEGGYQFFPEGKPVD